ncbi:membrane protein insertase YidC [Motiliproteus coralliicola]|uniref:Membrane protein insertase YidC n=1 Tax=Motiliproteus coralliicola TaxID=2283196 RepID=A0A369W9X2_9GAMM|nr:membrane protein insertase YidC [Motiliproteus coralliicola]RDE18810.1 membrane protein insertase YidC [Motiliproteus coralliicola]
MDFQRIGLIAALAVISYLLVLQWQKDYGDQAQPVASTPVSSYSSAPDIAAPESNGASANASNGDIPSTEAPEASAEVAVADNAAQGGLVKVTTDTLDLLIDTYGGDIIQAALPGYLAQLGNDQPLILLEQNSNRTYTAQSGLTGTNGPDAKGERPRYSVSAKEFSMADGQDSLSVDLVYQQDNNVTITKRFSFKRGEHLVHVEYLIDNQGDQAWQGNLFGQIKRDRSADPSSQTSMGMQSYLGPAFSNAENNYEKYDFDDIDEKAYKNKTEAGWVAMLQHYFVSAWIPNPEQSHNYFARERNDNYLAGFVSPSISVPAGQQGSVGANFYVGPKIQDALEQAAPNLKLTVDYGWLWWIAQPLFWLLQMIQSVVVNWGLAIILVTVVVKALFFHLSAKAYRSMAKMRAVSPELQRLKELYGDDRQKMSQAMMQLYQKEKINPMGGCLPILIQMPVFIALYWVLLESVELRHAPFMLWIQDMSVMDPYFVLPILMGVTMFFQQMLNPTPPDPMQAKVMKMLPFVFTFFFLWFPAGLVLYWVVNNILSIAQQWVITRSIEAEVQAKKS